MRRRYSGLILVIAILSVSSTDAAKFAGEAFELGVGARGMALGGAVVAGPHDASAAYWNPAGLIRLDGQYLIAMHAETFGSLLNHDYVGYANSRVRSSGKRIGFGVFGYYLGGGGIKITELDQFNRAIVDREENHFDLMLGASLAGQLDNGIDLGATVKVIYRDIGTESGVGLSLDVGALYDVREWLTVGLTLSDITTGYIRYGGGTETVLNDGTDTTTVANAETIYPTVRPGFAVSHTIGDWRGTVVGSGDIKFENLETAAQFWSGALSLDTHWGLEIGWREMVFGRTGFDIGRFTAGGGVLFRNISVDLAYLHSDDLDETFRVSAGYRW